MQVFNYGKVAADAMNQFGDSLSNAMVMRENRDEIQKQKDSLSGLSDLYSNGATTQELYEYGLKNPSAFERVGEVIGFKNDQTKQIMRDTLISSLQNPDNRDQIITQGAEAIRAAGGDPRYLSQAIGDDTESFERGAIPFLASLGADGANFAKIYMEKNPTPETMSEYQREKLELQRKTMEFNNKIKELEHQEKMLARKLSKEKDQLSIEKLEQELQKTKTEQAKLKSDEKSTMDSGYSGLVDTLNLVDAIEGHEGFSSAVGIQGSFPTFPGSKAAGVEGLIDTLSSQNFLNSVQQMKGMGALSDAEGKKLSSAVASLKPNMSEVDFKKALNVIRGITNRAKAKAESSYKSKGYDIPNVGNVYADSNQEKNSVAPKVGSIIDGYTYNGGDPANPKSWSKI